MSAIMKKRVCKDKFGGFEVKLKKISSRWLQLPVLIVALMIGALPLTAYAQGSIYGAVQNADLSTPANGEISFFGFLDDTDEEIRIETSTGAGYDAGNWFDDFQNYLTEAPGNPYDYIFYNVANSEGFHLQKLIPNNSFQQEDIQLASVSWPAQPIGLTATAVSNSDIVVSWNATAGLTYHVYRRMASSNGSFFRLDNTAGLLTDPGVTDSFYVDATVDGVSSYDYLIIAEDASGYYSQHSTVVTVNSSSLSSPIVNSIDPPSGLSVGGTLVNIYGSGFDIVGVDAIVGALSLTGVTVVSPFHVTGTTQAGTAGSADVTVNNLASGLISNILVGGFTYVANSAPTLDSIGPQAVVEGNPLNFTATASDVDGGNPIMTSSTLPGTATYADNGDGTADFSWTPTFLEAGIYNVTFYATDDIDPLLVDSEQVVITVTEAGNQDPVLAAIGPQNTIEDVQLTFGVSATDAESTPTLTTSTLPGTATFIDNGDGTGSFDWTPGFTDAGLYDVTFYATDAALAVDSEIVTITVTETGNQDPVLAAIGPQGIAETVQLTFGITASDPDEEIPTLTTSTLPGTATFLDNGDGTGTFDWTPGLAEAGIYDVTFYATDAALAVDSEIVTITVTDSNQDPVLAAIGAQNGTEDVQLTFGVSASDPDGDIPTLSTSALPGTATFLDNGDGTGTFDWTPSFADSGIYNVTFYATDGIYPTAIDSEEVIITVVNENQLPLLSAIGSQSVIEGGTLSFGVSAVDLDGDTPILSTSTLPGSAVFVDNGDGTGNFDWSTTFVDAGTHFVTFYAADSAYPLDIDSEIVTIVVGESGNQPPAWTTTLTDTIVQENDVLILNVVATDPEGNNIILSVNTIMDNYSFVDNGDGSGVLTYSPTYEDAGVDTVRFIAMDDGIPSLSSILTVAITTYDVNQPPEFELIGPFTIEIEDTLEFIVTAFDSTGTPSDRLYLSVLNLPTNATFIDNLDNTGTFTFAPVLGQEGIDTVTFLATDQGSPTQTGVMPVEITVAIINYPPDLGEIGPQAVLEGELLIIDMAATDPEGMTPILEAVNAPENSTFIDNGDGTAQFTFTPSFLQAGLFYVTFQASDGLDIDKEIVLIQVYEAGDQAPIFTYVPAITGIEGDTLGDTIVAIDPDLDPVILTVDEATVPDNFTFTDQGDGMGLIVFLPDFTQAGLYDVDFIATAGTLADTVTVTIDVVEFGNHTPTLDPISDQEVTELNQLQFTVTASDIDGVDPVLSASDPLPGSAVFSSTTGIFSWTPTDTDSGSYVVWFYATDGDPAFPTDIDSAMITITVIDTNRVPMFFINPMQPDTVMEGDTLLRVITAWDVDGPTPKIEAFLEGTIDSLVPNMSIYDSGNGTAVLTFAPDYHQGDSIPPPTFYYFRFRVIDSVDENISEISSTQTIRVFNNPQPPIMYFSSGTGPFDITEGDTLSFDVTPVDPDGAGIPQMRVEGMPANCDTSTAIATLTFEFRPDFLQAGSYSVTFIAQDVDALALADTQVVVINVLDAGNQAPYFTSELPDTILAFVGTQVTTYLEAADPDGDAMTFDATDTLSGATLLNDGGGNARYVYDPDLADLWTTKEVRFIVSDPGGLTDTVITYYTIVSSKRGDSDANGTYNVYDIVFLVNYLFRGGEEPYPLESGDADMNGSIEVADVVYMINFLYFSGPRPPQ